MQKGFLTYALNSPKYLQLAANLAATLKASDYEARIALVTNLEAGQFAGVFDQIIQTDEFNPFYLKIRAYELSPFKETFFVDADTVFNHLKFAPSDLWQAVKDVDFSFPCLAVNPPSVSWVDLAAFRAWADIDTYPALYSGLFYFKRSRAANAYFKAAKSIYGTYPECGTIGNYYPDEPFFSVAAAKKGLTFGEINGYIYKADSPTCNETAILRYAFMTMPGSPSREHRRLYNAIVLKAGAFGFPVERYQK